MEGVRCFLVIFVFVYARVNALVSDQFREELFVKTLPTGQLYNHFQFTTIWNVTLNSSQSKHYRLFPRALGEVFERFGVKELDLSFTQGRWRHEFWGYPLVDASKGAELLVWFSAQKDKIDLNWSELVNVLSGMFCASLNFMDVKATISPRISFRPTGYASEKYKKYFANHVRYAVLPNENVCTENLTPWKKLLPCGFKAGLSTLLNAFKLYDSSYHSLSIKFRHVCLNDACDVIGLELSQRLGVVFDPIITLGSQINKPDWSLKKYFGRMISNSCPLASSSNVYYDLTYNNQQSHLTPEPSYIKSFTRGNVDIKHAVYDIKSFLESNSYFNLDVKYDAGIFNQYYLYPSLITASRFQTGFGQVSGGVMCLIHNRHKTENILANYLEILPHYLKVYLHTLKIEYFPGEMSSVENSGEKILPLKIFYQPGKDNNRPYHLEVSFKLPANSVTRLSFQFEKQLLKWTDYPPDPNHGFYIAPSVITVTLPSAENITLPVYDKTFLNGSLVSDGNGNSDYTFKLRTEALLVTLPTPDFSMPYNVICLVCTVIAIAFGSVHNLTTKRFVAYDPNKHKNIFQKVAHRLWSWKQKMFRSANIPDKKS